MCVTVYLKAKIQSVSITSAVGRINNCSYLLMLLALKWDNYTGILIIILIAALYCTLIVEISFCFF